MLKLSPSETEPMLGVKNLLPLKANSFLSEKIPFQTGIDVQETKWKVRKSYLPYKENLPNVSIFLGIVDSEGPNQPAQSERALHCPLIEHNEFQPLRKEAYSNIL